MPPVGTTARTGACGSAVVVNVRTPVPISNPIWNGLVELPPGMISWGTGRRFWLGLLVVVTGV
ncbi:hypothetical protein [Nonomuraea sp. KM90]|uniref:hypothetical protein n=1 Tax=Nonomuraea sp. KM90 TaxID=3457428 RepID=UPI003FCDAC21